MNWKNLFRFTGRATRQEFILLSSVCYLVSFLVLILRPNQAVFQSVGQVVGQLVVSLLIILPLSLVNLWINLALYARRFHDLNFSAWWILPYLVLPVGAVGVSSPSFWWIGTALGMAFWLCLALKKGSPSKNRFGAVAPEFFPTLSKSRAVVGICLLVALVLPLFTSIYAQKQAQQLEQNLPGFVQTK